MVKYSTYLGKSSNAKAHINIDFIKMTNWDIHEETHYVQYCQGSRPRLVVIERFNAFDMIAVGQAVMWTSAPITMRLSARDAITLRRASPD